MAVEQWSDNVILATLQDDPSFTEDMNLLIEMVESRPGCHCVLDLSEVNYMALKSKLVAIRPAARMKPLKCPRRDSVCTGYSTFEVMLRRCGSNVGDAAELRCPARGDHTTIFERYRTQIWPLLPMWGKFNAISPQFNPFS